MSEYLPLAELIEKGLQEGTVLELVEFSCEKEWHFAWNGSTVVYADNEAPYNENPLDPNRRWRIVSTPPKKITFEAVVRGGCLHVVLQDFELDMPDGPVIVTVEEKR